MAYTFKRVFETVRPCGFYYVEDHGADVAGGFLLGICKGKGGYGGRGQGSDPGSNGRGEGWAFASVRRFTWRRPRSATPAQSSGGSLGMGGTLQNMAILALTRG